MSAAGTPNNNACSCNATRNVVDGQCNGPPILSCNTLQIFDQLKPLLVSQLLMWPGAAEAVYTASNADLKLGLLSALTISIPSIHGVVFESTN